MTPPTPDGGDDGGSVLVDPIDCGDRDITRATVLAGDLGSSTTLSGVIHVTGDVMIRNEAVVSVAPGTKFIVAAGVSIEVAPQGNQPTFIVDGTPEAPVRFCGEAATPGYWKGLVFHPTTRVGSALRNALIADAGLGGAALTLHAPVALQGLQILRSSTAGIAADVFGAPSHNVRVEEAATYPVVLEDDTGVNSFPSSAVFTNNGTDVAFLAFSTFDQAVTFRKLSVPWRPSGDIAATTSDPVTFEAGAIYELTYAQRLDLDTAPLLTAGTAADPVVFRCPPGVCEDSGSNVGGGGVRLGASVGSSLVYTRFEGLGWYCLAANCPLSRYGAALTLATADAVTLQYVDFPFSFFEAIDATALFSPASGHITMDRVTSLVQGTPYVGIEARAVVTFPADTVFTDPAGTVSVRGQRMDVSGVIPKLGARLNFTGLIIEDGTEVTILPGTTLYFGLNSVHVNAGGKLTAVGTPTEPIVFTGTVPATTWSGFFFFSSDVVLDYVQVSRAGLASGAAISAQVPVTILNSSISDSRGWGILKRASDPTDYLATNTFSGNALGDVGTLP